MPLGHVYAKQVAWHAPPVSRKPYSQFTQTDAVAFVVVPLVDVAIAACVVVEELVLLMALMYAS
jgi:hypothetical protein